MEQSEPVRKRHHHTPEYYLRRWAGEDGRLFVHRGDWPAPRAINVSNVGVERHLYTLSDPHPDVRADVVERALADLVDAPASAIIPKLISGEPISLDERITFARHLYLQNSRSPWMRDQATRLFTQSHQMVLDELVQSEKFRRDVLDAAPPEFRFTATELLDSGGLRVQVSGDMWIAFLFEQLFESDHPARIAALGWKVIETKTGTFVTSDVPIVSARVAARASNGKRRGWYSDAFETTYPLGPRHALLMRDGLDPSRVLAPAGWRKDQNRRVIGAARREVYATEPRPEIGPSIGQWSSSGMQMTVTQLPDNSDLVHFHMPELAGRALY